MLRTGPEYTAPSTLEDALRIKREHGSGARVVAGGTDLILRMRDRVLQAEVLIDLRHLGQDSISAAQPAAHIGAGVTIEQVLQHKDIRQSFPALAESCGQFAGPPIRNRGTVAGNIVNASPAADLAPPLMAYDAAAVLQSLSGRRVVRLDDFFTAPGKTIMSGDEILTAIQLPMPPPDTAASFIKLGQRRSMAISVVSVCARLSLAGDGTVGEARIVLGAVAPTPVRAERAEALLSGRNPDDELLERVAVQACREASPIDDPRASARYRHRMVRVLVRRALEAVRAELKEGRPDG
jgi:carbon-monoxide dehydrogenase medium subunit